MSFHFPLMPRLYMAVRRADRLPITDIFTHTPAIPPSCQWCLFLRNHDELTLEMVTNEERDYMYYSYASDPQMKLNLGIRRRLAPLMENDRRRIELLNCLLLTLPGSPIIYYGDEIGMGDNIYLGDRNGVRTPMQWSSDRNAGFSSAEEGRLYLPVIGDPVYGYQAVNVAAQERTPSSLLNTMKRLIAARKRTPAFGRGTIEFLRPRNQSVLAFLRRHGDDTLLVVCNLSERSQPVELELSAFRGAVPTELLGETRFPPITAQPYFLSLGSHGFYWFRLEGHDRRPARYGIEDTAI
jgi:maltose alpha-D-glucosyltransferase/alpha-amylase